MQNNRTKLYQHLVHLPAPWKFLFVYKRTAGFILLGAAIALIAGAALSPLLPTHQSSKDSSESVLALSTRAITIDPTTQAITLKAIERD
jgi:hypothetical protein